MVNLFARARFLMSGASLDVLPAPDRPEVAFAGRSNSGKSSALNQICNQKQLARVSKTPGRTQLINFFELAEGRLVDLPGYGFAQVPDEVRRDWGRLVGGFIEVRQSLKAVVLLMDSRRPLTDIDRQMLVWVHAERHGCHILLSKSDKLRPSEARALLRDVAAQLGPLHPQATVQLFSALSGQGVDEAREKIGNFFKDAALPHEA